MANPLSGLENIGQSYLQGLQLANQRQYREEAAAQRAEDTRVRGQYYQDLVDQRREASTLNAKLREEGLAIRFGKSLKYKPDGSIDIVGSATAQEESGNRGQFLETAGFAASNGVPIPGQTITEEERKSAFYNRGLVQGIVEKAKRDEQMARILASQGVFRADRAPVSTAGVEPMITNRQPETIFDILSAPPQRRQFRTSAPSRASLLQAPPETYEPPGTYAPQPRAYAPQSRAYAPTETYAPQPRASMVPIRINNQDYVTRAPAAKAEKLPSLGYETLELPDGAKARINLTPERVQQIRAQASKLAAGEGEPDFFVDLDAAQQQLKKLRVGGETDFNIQRLKDGTIKVIADDAFSIGRTASEIQEDLKLERKNREQILKESKTMPGPEAGIQQGTNRVQPRTFGNTLFEMGGSTPVRPIPQSPNRVIDVRQIPGLRPLPGR
jgi:hypothetical protein